MSAFSTVPKIYYWPLIGRSGCLIRMLDYMGEKYEFFSEFGEIAAIATVFGADSDIFAPPYLVDGDVTISQSNAATMYLGDKLGLNEGITVPAKAVQYMSDIYEIFEGNIQRLKEKGGELAAYVSGDRFKKQTRVVENAIKGPFFFGEKPTYVDFFLLGYYDAASIFTISHLVKAGAANPFAGCTKMLAVVEALQKHESYGKHAGNAPAFSSNNMEIKPEDVAAYLEAMAK